MREVNLPPVEGLPVEKGELVEAIVHGKVVDLRRYDFNKKGEKLFRAWMVIYPLESKN